MTATILVGDVRDRLRDLPDASVQMVCTSPPYYNLRDYGVPRQIGLEPTLGAYIATMVDVFREVKRVLRDDGTIWLNLGDSYATQGGRGEARMAELGRPSPSAITEPRARGNAPGSKGRGEFKPKDLMMVPARVALALQADGWWIRSDIIWAKPNPMPESVTDRPTSAHEHIFLLTKSAQYYYDAEAVRQPPMSDRPDMALKGLRTGLAYLNGNTDNSTRPARRTDKQRGHSRRHDGFNDRWDAMPKNEQQAMGANLRNVWTIATHPFSEAHFATFPPELARRCIKAGSKPGDTILDPFAGSGTVGLVADQLGRDSVLIELSPTYAEMARKRIAGDAPMFAEVAVLPLEVPA